MKPPKKHENQIFVACYGEFFENSLTSQEASGSNVDLEVIQDEDTRPFENTSEHHNEVEHRNIKLSSDVVPIRISARIPQAPDRYGYYVDVEEHELRDLNEPPNHKVALSDCEFDKTIRSKWLSKKKTDMDGKVHAFKARLMAKGYTKTYSVDYGETFSPIVDIRSINILLAIAAFYDYEF
ncbi:retrotransposon protein, putative, ty1-copia subclass [Tanacetum coccineum]